MHIDLFLFILALNWQWYLLFLLLSIGVLLPIAGKYSLGWFDPFRYAIIFAMFANAVPPFLLYVGHMKLDTFIYFILSEGFFWIGLLRFAKKREPLSKITISGENNVLYFLFLIAFSLYVTFTLLSYIMFGIPVFMDKSWLSVYQSSGGFGFFQRINDFLTIFCLIYTFHLLHNKQKKRLAYISIGITSLFLVLTASKSAFLNVLFAYFGYSLFYLQKVPRTKKILLYLTIGTIAAILILVVQVGREGGDTTSGIIALFVRFIASGDCYFMAYPNDTYKAIETGNSFMTLFGGFLSTCRIIDVNSLYPSIGNQLSWLIAPNTTGSDVGPNARMPILSYLLFGWGGILFAYIAGAVTSYGLFRLPRYFPSGILSTAYVTYMYIILNKGVTDLIVSTFSIFSELMNLGVAFLMLYFTLWIMRKKETSA